MDVLSRAVFSTDLGWMCAVADANVLFELTFNHASPGEAVASLRFFPGSPERRPSAYLNQLMKRLQRFSRAAKVDFRDLSLNLEGRTPFQRAVIEACRNITPGMTTTYGELAARAGRPHAARAVGQVMATNRFPIIVPCHRVLGCNGSLGGYSAREGLLLKRRLLDLETAQETLA